MPVPSSTRGSMHPTSSGSRLVAFRVRGSIAGARGFAEFMHTWTEDFDEFTLRLERLIDAGENRVVGLFHHTGIGKGSGAAVELHQGLVYELEDCRIVRCRNFFDHASALEAVGLRE